MVAENNTERWVLRYANFAKACTWLSQINEFGAENTPSIVCEGFIKRFEIAFDLAWKTVRDYLVYLGHDVQPSPRPVIKEAFRVGIIADGQAFIDMIDVRNLIAHAYDENASRQVFERIRHEFYPALRDLCKYLMRCIE